MDLQNLICVTIVLLSTLQIAGTNAEESLLSQLNTNLKETAISYAAKHGTIAKRSVCWQCGLTAKDAAIELIPLEMNITTNKPIFNPSTIKPVSENLTTVKQSSKMPITSEPGTIKTTRALYKQIRNTVPPFQKPKKNSRTKNREDRNWRRRRPHKNAKANRASHNLHQRVKGRQNHRSRPT